MVVWMCRRNAERRCEMKSAIITWFCFIVFAVLVFALGYRLTYETHRHFHDKLHAEMKEGVK